MTNHDKAHWLADKIPAYGDYAKEAALVLRKQADEIERLREALAALLACPSGMYCDAYPAAEKQAQALLVPNAKGEPRS